MKESTHNNSKQKAVATSPLQQEALLPLVREALQQVHKDLRVHLVQHLNELVPGIVRAENAILLEEHTALKPLLTVRDVAKTLQVSCRTIETLIARGTLRPLWIKGQRRFHPDAIEAYLRACQSKPRKGRASS